MHENIGVRWQGGRIRRIAITGTVAAFIAMLAALFFYDPSSVPIYPVCHFHQLTGLDCPGCGSLRALHRLMHGEFFAAFRFNPLLILSLPLLGWLGVRFAWRAASGQPAPAIRSSWVWVYLAVWVAFGVARNVPMPLWSAAAQ